MGWQQGLRKTLDSEVAFPVSTFVNCANMGNSTQKGKESTNLDNVSDNSTMLKTASLAQSFSTKELRSGAPSNYLSESGSPPSVHGDGDPQNTDSHVNVIVTGASTPVEKQSYCVEKVSNSTSGLSIESSKVIEKRNIGSEKIGDKDPNTVTVTLSVPHYPIGDETTRYTCTQCKYSCTRETVLKDHRAKVHGEKDLFQCTLCHYAGQLFKHLQKHMVRQHGVHLSSNKPFEEQQKTFPASKPSKETPRMDKSRAEKRTLTIHGPRPNKYKPQPIGNKIKVIDDSIKAKLLSMISKYNFNISLKDKWTGSIKLVSILKPTANQNEASSQGTQLDAIGQSQPLSCSECSKMFKQKRSLVAHENVHRGRYPFECSECDKAFSCRNLLQQHTKTHSPVREHHCTQPGCAKSFRTNSR